MANLYDDIERILDKILMRMLSADRRGIKINKKNEKFGFIDVIILRVVGQLDGVSVFDLIYTLDMDRGIVSTAIGKLIKNNYLIKERSEQDGRVQNLKLTDDGKELYELIQKKETELINFVLHDLTSNEQKAILKFLSRIRQTMVSKYDIEKIDYK